MAGSYVNPFTGQTIAPSSIGYEALTISTNTVFSWPINGNLSTSTPVSSIVDVTATVASLTLSMPPATQVSSGQSALLRNIGAISFIVVDNSGNTIASIAPGIAQFVFLTDNTTTAGIWSSVVFGAGTSTANAAVLAGSGLLATGTTLNTAIPLVGYFSNATLSSANRAQFIVWGSGVGTITLPSAVVIGNNWFVIIRNNGTGILNVTPSGTDTIDGNVNQQLNLSESLVVVSNGVNGFNTYAYGRSASFFFTQLSFSVTGGTLVLSATQAANQLQMYAGALTSNQIVVVPSTVQLYTVTNNTTGAYSLTVNTAVAGGAAAIVPQGTSMVLISDGTNIYNATSGSASSFTTITLGNGSLSLPSLKFSGDSTTGLYLPSAGTMALVASGVRQFDITSTGVKIYGTTTATGAISTASTVTATGGMGGGAF